MSCRQRDKKSFQIEIANETNFLFNYATMRFSVAPCRIADFNTAILCRANESATEAKELFRQAEQGRAQVGGQRTAADVTRPEDRPAHLGWGERDFSESGQRSL